MIKEYTNNTANTINITGIENCKKLVGWLGKYVPY